MEKTIIEQYGIILGAATGATISVVSSLLTFYLTKNKDNKREDKAIRSKIFADISEVTTEFKDLILERDLMLLNVRYYHNLITNVKNLDLRGVREAHEAAQEKYTELLTKVNTLKQIYFAKVFNYLFHKETNTVVAELQKRLRGVGLNFKPDNYESSDMMYCNEFLILQQQKCKTYHSNEVLGPIGKILDAIIRNK